MGSSTIPLDVDTVDFGAFMNAPDCVTLESLTAEQRAIAKQVDKSFREDGFLFLKNFGLSEEDLKHAFSLSKKLFSLPHEHKMSQLKRIDEISDIGYVPYGHETLNRQMGTDIKEAYNFKSNRKFQQDFCGCPPGFEEMTQAFHQKMERVGLNFATACAVALNLPINFFRKHLKEADLTTFRVIRYPPCDFCPDASTGNDYKSSIRVGEHTDFELFTLLFTDSPGLQAKPVKGGEIGGKAGGEKGGWVNIPVKSGATAIVNLGSLMARWTNDVWKATAHRVIASNPEEGNRERFSIACFFDPGKGTLVTVHPSFVAKNAQPNYEPLDGYEHLQRKLKEAHGYQD